MIVDLLAYGLVVGMLLAGSAWLLEGALRLHAKSLRWIWAAALLATAGLIASSPLRQSSPDPAPRLPAATAQLGIQTHADAAPTLPTGVYGFFAAAVAPIDVVLAQVAAVLPDASSQRLNRGVAIGWTGASGVLLLLFLSTILRSASERRRWPQRCLHGTAVRVAPATGPMVAGVLRPEIVVPEWLLSSPPAEQRLVLAHEREHVRGGDPLLLACGFLMVALLPWNPAVWWMAARLRLAVELDCDRRVLRGGATRAAYGSTLLDIATRRTGGFFPAPALLESSSQLERRLIMMTPRMSRFARARSLGLATLASALALAACDQGLPSAPEIEQMDVAAAEAGAQRVGIGSLSNDPNTVYTIDGRVVSAKDARALDPARIASIEVRKPGGDGHSTVAIFTPKGLVARGISPAEEGTRDVEVYLEQNEDIDASKEGSSPQRVVIRDGVATVDGEIVKRPESWPPLLLIDGQVVDDSKFGSLDPDAIEKIEVLKGTAATELYSDPAARNGVILITTKKPGGG